MARLIDSSVAVNSNTMSPPSTNIRVEITPHRRGAGFWQVSSVNQGLHTGAPHRLSLARLQGRDHHGRDQFGSGHR